MSGVERIAAHAGLSRNSRWTDTHDSALMIRVMSFTTDQAREGSSIGSRSVHGGCGSCVRLPHYAPLDLHQYPIALFNGLGQDRCRHRHRARHERSIALAAIPPVRGMSRLDHHIRAAQAYSGATARFARRGLAATTRGLRLEHAPAIGRRHGCERSVSRNTKSM